MRNKHFIVSHPRARHPLTITGHTLAEALEKEGLDPNIWKPLHELEEVEDKPVGDNQGDARPEDN